MCLSNLAIGQLDYSVSSKRARDAIWSADKGVEGTAANSSASSSGLLSGNQALAQSPVAPDVGGGNGFSGTRLMLLPPTMSPTNEVSAGVQLVAADPAPRLNVLRANFSTALLPEFSSRVGTVAIFSAIVSRPPVRLRTLIGNARATSIATDLEAAFPPTLNTLFAGMVDRFEPGMAGGEIALW